MSGQWEVVGKKKDKSNGKLAKQIAVKEQQQQKLINSINVEDVLPMSQLKNLYSSKGNKENQKPEKNVKKENNGQPKPAKQQQPAKKPQDNKPKQYKSIENAYNAIKPDDLSGVYDNNKVVYPTTPIVWLRELAQFLNVNINVDVQDVTFSNKPDNYPLCTMPSALRSILEKGLKQAGAENCALFFDICLASMANDMNKSLPAIGHKLFIQLLAQQQPKLCAGNVTKYVTLRNSYQNRPNIGTSVLWALGQGGFKDLSVGLKVFQDIMYPIMDMKNYTRFVLKYLISILNKHSKSSSSLTKDQYLFIVDIVYANKKNMTSDITKELNSVMPVANDLALAGNEKMHAYVEPLLQKLGQTTNKACKNQLNYVLAKCMEKDSTCLATWGHIYGKNLPASALLLTHIEQNWRSTSSQIDVKVLKEMLKTLAATNAELDAAGNKREDGLEDCMNAIRKLNNKMAGSKKKGRSKCRFLTYALFAVISGFIFVDVRQNGGWNNSCTSKALNKTGVYDYTHKAYDRAFECTQWMHHHIEERFPGITESTIQYTTPYIELGRDLGIILGNVANNAKEGIQSRIPYVIESIETHAPGLIETTQEFGKKTASTVCSYYENGKEYLLKNVFVGKLAPEEIQKTVTMSVELGVEKAQEYYSWLYNKIMTAIK